MMVNTYSQINIQVVFSVKGRDNLLNSNIRTELFPYISGIMKNIGLYPLAVNGWSDHVHIFFDIKPHILLSKAVETIKSNSSRWINERRFLPGKFQWQRSYAAFSYSKSQRDPVIKYILNQEKHHQVSGNTFKKEYLKLLEMFEIEYDPKYLFEFYD